VICAIWRRSVFSSTILNTTIFPQWTFSAHLCRWANSRLVWEMQGNSRIFTNPTFSLGVAHCAFRQPLGNEKIDAFQALQGDFSRPRIPVLHTSWILRTLTPALQNSLLCMPAVWMAIGSPPRFSSAPNSKGSTLLAIFLPCHFQRLLAFIQG
jgi:hypothetical protein